MKRSLLIFVGILVGLFMALSLLDRRGEYAAEEILWGANKKLSDVARSPEAVPEKVYQDILRQYERVISGFPQSKLVPNAYILRGRVYLVKKEFDTARQKFREVMERFPQNESANVEALSAIGSSYELQDNWSEALKVYEKIESKYPLSDLGLSIPLYIANYYVRNKHDANAKEAFSDAENYYQKLADDHENSEAEVKALALLSNCYMAQKKWDDAMGVMGKVILKFPAPNVLAPMMKNMNAVVLTKVKNFDRVIGIYEEFLKKYPKHPFTKPVKDMIEGFKILKDKRTSKLQLQRANDDWS